MNTNKLAKLGAVLAAGAIPAINALAGVFVITDDAQPAAKGDLEAHLNWESSIATDHNRFVDTGIGLELAYGATETLEVAASLDFGWTYSSHDYGKKVEDAKHQDDFNFTGISLGLKEQILDPESAEDPFGLCMVGGFSWAWAGTDASAARDIGFDLGLNFQKNLLDGDLILAFTPGVSFGTSYIYDEERYSDFIVYSIGFGFSYQVVEGLRLGAEASYEITYEEGDDGSIDYSDNEFYAGPNLCYEGESWWITICIAPRLFTTDHSVLAVAQLGWAF